VQEVPKRGRNKLPEGGGKDKSGVKRCIFEAETQDKLQTYNMCIYLFDDGLNGNIRFFIFPQFFFGLNKKFLLPLQSLKKYG
jgi:hypothetical protein